MNSRIFTKFVFLLFFIFILHLFLYYFFDTYKNFFISIKYNEETIEEKVDTGSLSTKNITAGFSNYTGSSVKNTGEIIDIGIEKTIKNEIINDEITFSGDIDGIEITEDEQFVIDLFKKYNLERLINHNSLFDLTTEYPEPYLEYYDQNDEITLYIFQNKLYNDIANIFDVISYNLPFKIKKVNNFGEESFYINMNSVLEDEFIRFIFSYKNKVFGLKLKKDSYNDVKEILNNLK